MGAELGVQDTIASPQDSCTPGSNPHGFPGQRPHAHADTAPLGVTRGASLSARRTRLCPGSSPSRAGTTSKAILGPDPGKKHFPNLSFL